MQIAFNKTMSGKQFGGAELFHSGEDEETKEKEWESDGVQIFFESEKDCARGIDYTNQEILEEGYNSEYRITKVSEGFYSDSNQGSEFRINIQMETPYFLEN